MHSRSSRALPPRPPAFCTSAARAPALFNWLFARHHGGKSLLRIEDTDKARSTQEAIDAILDGLRWLGLDWDGHEYYQSQFWARHAEIAHKLLDRGHAYRCYMTQEELAAQRERRRPSAGRSGSTARGATSRPSRPASPSSSASRPRARAKRSIDDLVQGRVTVQNAELDDFVLLRSDGTPTYMLAVVVDDHDMGVTHVIRGDDHLNNAFRQLAIIRAMGWPEPTYAHIPLIHGPDGAKLQQAPRRARRRRLSRRAGDPARGVCSTICSGSAGAMATTRSSAATRRSNGSTSTMSANRRRASTSRSSRTSTAIISARPTTQRLADLVAPRLGARRRARRACCSRAMPELKARAHTISTSSPKARISCSPTRPLAIVTRPPRHCSRQRRAACSSFAHDALGALDEWTHDSTEAAVRDVADQARRQARQARPAAARGADRADDLPGIFDVLVLLG